MGTSGSRGLFVISQRDRVAVLLPLNTPLYDSANQATGLKPAFFDVNRPLESLGPKVQTFAPTVLIAAPRILCRLIDLQIKLSPRRIFSASKNLDPIDRHRIEAGFGMPLGEIYMATAGLLAVTCAHNRLHLAKDCLHFELQPAGGDLVSPIITDFSRKPQIMARYRMNDLLALDARPSPCGSPLRIALAGGERGGWPSG